MWRESYIPADSRELVKRMKAILNVPRQEIYAMLVECDMDPDEAITRLISQDAFQKVKSKRDKKKENREFRNGGGGNNFNSDGTNNHLAGSHTTSAILAPSPSKSHLTDGESKRLPMDSGEAVDSSSVLSLIITNQPPSNSELTNGETKRVPVSSGEAVSSLSVPSSRYGSFISGERTMAEVVDMGLSLCKENVTKESVVGRDQLVESAPISNQNSYNEDVTYRLSESLRMPCSEVNQNLHSDGVANPPSNSFIESAARRERLGESASTSKQKLLSSDISYPLSEPYDPLQRSPTENIQGCPDEYLHPFSNIIEALLEEKKPALKIPDHLQGSTSELQRLTFGSFGSGMKASGRHSSLPSHSEYANDVSLKDLNIRNADLSKEEEQRLRNYHSSSNYDETEPAQENQYKSSAATDLIFDNGHWLDHELGPSELSPQMQNSKSFPNVMSMPKQHNSTTTAFSVGRKPSISMTEALKTATIFVPQKNQRAMNHHNSQPKVRSGHHGINSPYWPPKQNNSYNMYPSAFQQHGGDNTANSRFGYDNVSSSKIIGRSQLPSFQHQSGNSNVWLSQRHNDSRVQSGSDYYNLISGHQNQQPPSFRLSQLEQEHDQLSRRHNDSRVRSGSDYYRLISGHQNQQSFKLSQQEQELDQLSQRHNYSRVQSGSDYYSYLSGHQNQKPPNFRLSQPEQEHDQLSQRHNTSHLQSGSDYYRFISGHQNQQSSSFRLSQQEQEHDQLSQRHNYSRVQSGSDYYSLISGHQNQQSLSSRLSQQEQEHDQHYKGFGYGRRSPYYASLNEQNTRTDPSNDPNQTQQQQWGRKNY